MSNKTKYYVLLSLLVLSLTMVISFYCDYEEPAVLETVQDPEITQPSEVEICYAIVSDTLNETYLFDNEYTAVSIWKN